MDVLPRLWMPALLDVMSGSIKKYAGSELGRVGQKAYHLEDEEQADKFLTGATERISIPVSDEPLAYDPLKRVGIGLSVLGTRKSVGIGAYAYAIHALDMP